MSIATAIQNAQAKVAAAYTAAAAKGATVPAVQNLGNLANTITSIPAGGGGAPAHYIEKTVVNGKLQNTPTMIDLTGVTDVGAYVLAGQYFNATFPADTHIDMSSLTTISGFFACYSMFSGSSVTSVDLSSLTTISGDEACQTMLQGCSRLARIDLSSLTTISGVAACNAMLGSCRGLTGMDLSSLATISGSTACNAMLMGCTGLTSMSFPSLREILPATTQNQFNGKFINCNALTEIHYPSNMQSRIEQLTGYATKFGATNATIYFDLPATVILTGANASEYERNPKYDTATALAWRIKNTGTTAAPVIDWTPFYTSGTSDPAVGDTLYSDAECTTTVTTIDSIA